MSWPFVPFRVGLVVNKSSVEVSYQRNDESCVRARTIKNRYPLTEGSPVINFAGPTEVFEDSGLSNALLLLTSVVRTLVIRASR